MAYHAYYYGHPVMSWMIALAVVYAVLILITLVLAIRLAYHGDTPYQQMPERYRNRRWVRPLLPIIFIILPALFWPIVMIGTGVLIVAAFILHKNGGICKKMRGSSKEPDVEMGLQTNLGNLNEQPSSEHNPPANTHSETATIVSEPPPTYTPHDRARRLPEEELARLEVRSGSQQGKFDPLV